MQSAQSPCLVEYVCECEKTSKAIQEYTRSTTFTPAQQLHSARCVCFYLVAAQEPMHEYTAAIGVSGPPSWPRWQTGDFISEKCVTSVVVDAQASP